MRTVPESANRKDWPRLVANALGDVRKELRGNQAAMTVDALTVQTVRFTPQTVPSSPVAGLTYYDSGTNKLRCYNGTTWNDLF